MDAENAITARAVWFRAPYRVELGDVPLAPPGPDEIRVRAEFSGISAGTELLAYRGELDPATPKDETLGALAGTFVYPFTYGYSVVGTAESSSADIAEGARVFAFHPHQDRLVVPADDVVPVGDVDPRSATLLPLVETALQLTLDAGVRYREVVAVLGLGPVGVLTALLLVRNGATVVASDGNAGRRDVASACGIRTVAPGGLREAVTAASDGRGADVLVEATGNPDVLGESLPLLAHEGVALVASWYGSKPVTLPLGGEFHRRRLEIRSSQVSTVGSRAGRWHRRRRLETAVALLAELPLSALASHTFPFERAADAYAALDRQEDGLLHVGLAYS